MNERIYTINRRLSQESGDVGSVGEKLAERIAQIKRGGKEEYHKKQQSLGKYFVRKRLELLLDEGSFIEDYLWANCEVEELPADGVITGVGKINGRIVAVMANDFTVKAGSWGPKTVEKIIRIQEKAIRLGIPIIYMVDSAGARITEQVNMFPGQRGAGRIFFNQVQMSGYVPQICVLFGPSAAGGAYIPAFSDIVIMVEGNGAMYLGSPRMVKEAIGEVTTIEEMGGARLHCEISGCGDILVKDEDEAIDFVKRYLDYMPQNSSKKPERKQTQEPIYNPAEISSIIPEKESKPFNMYDIIFRIIDRESWFEIKELYAKEIITGFARIDGYVVGIVANQPKVRGGVLFVESANKAARFIWLCDAFNIPIIFLADVPGFMIGTKVEKEGIIRAGAKMIAAVSETTVPKISVILRKAYGAGLYAMAGPAFESDYVIALPHAKIAVMGPEAAVRAVYHNKIEALPEEERLPYISELIREYQADINIYRLASEMIVDDIIDGSKLREELVKRLNTIIDGEDTYNKIWRLPKKHIIPPM